ncbi:MAG TPA: ribonuclease H [Kofleriaceae bacterium]|nr:ribonuclease H [Kofleriaceae bacterium]
MPWKRHILRDQQIWAEVDAAGNLVTDEAGRVAVIYKRDANAKIYRAGSRNLGVVANAPVEPDLGPATAAPAAADGGAAGGGAPARKPAASRSRSVDPGPAAADTVHVWTDGACTGNPGPAGIGVVVIDGDKRREHSEYLGPGTNNIAELTAVLRGLDMVGDAQRPVRVYTDSSYSIGVLSMNWKAKANVELVAEIRDRLRAFPRLAFVKVAGHAGIPENERCDELARNAITGRRR